MKYSVRRVRRNLTGYITTIMHGDIIRREKGTFIVRRSFPRIIAGINLVPTQLRRSRSFASRLEQRINSRLTGEQVHIGVNCVNGSMTIVATLVRVGYCPSAHQTCPDHTPTCLIHMAA